jgi:hypothetical protein
MNLLAWRPWGFEDFGAAGTLQRPQRLNKGEQQNALRRAVFFFNRLGEIRDRSYEKQR